MPTQPLSDDLAREAAEAWAAHGGSWREAAAALGLARSTFQNRLRHAKARGFHLSPGVRAATVSAGMSGLEVQGGWLHSYDDDGKKTAALRFSTPKDAPEADVVERVRDALSDIPPAPEIAPPPRSDDDLITVYPLADVHIGMMAWWRETGADYDARIAADRVRSWVARAVDASPPSGTAVILGVGDLTHADDQSNMTPTSKHVLDVDTRHFKTLEITIAAMACAIERASQKHARVLVRILPGNHDMNTYLAVMFGLAQRYRNSTRVEVQTVPGEFWVHRHGRCLLAAHHGHGGKPQRMVMFLADEYAEQWGQTQHRFLWTGHRHSLSAEDIGGVQWEQLRAMTNRDAYAVGKAYSARAQLQAITLHATDGEVQRVKVNA